MSAAFSIALGTDSGKPLPFTFTFVKGTPPLKIADRSSNAPAGSSANVLLMFSHPP